MKRIPANFLVVVLMALGFGIYFTIPDSDDQTLALENSQSERRVRLRIFREPLDTVQSAQFGADKGCGENPSGTNAWPT